MKKKTVVIGGSGFIGTELCKELSGDCDLVIADVKPPMDEFKECWKYVDVTDSYSVFEVTRGARFVYHLAANPSPFLANMNPAWDLRLNVLGTLNVINGCIQHGARMLFASTLFGGGNYKVSKRTAEQYICGYVSKEKLDAVIVRLANVYGPSQTLGFVIPDFIQKLSQNPEELHIRGTGYDLRDFVFISDVVNALKIVMERGMVGTIYEVGTGRAFTILELAETLTNLVNLHPKIVTEREGSPPKVRNGANILPILKLGWKPKVTPEEGLKKCLKET